MITAALPTYNNADIIWLQLESFCRQTPTDFELIVIEEKSEKYFGKDELLKYKSRLKKAGCKRLVYLSLSKWVPLARKWIIAAENIHPDSLGMMLCASDNYSHKDRFMQTKEALINGADWIQWDSGVFYNILNNTAGQYTARPHLTGLFMAISKRTLNHFKPVEYPKKGVDSWLFKHSNPRKQCRYEFTKGLHTDGFNTISHGRRLIYEASPLFNRFNPDEAFGFLPKDIQSKIITLKKNNHAS